MLFLLFLILLSLGGFILVQYQKEYQANTLYNQAKELETKKTKNLYKIIKLNNAVKLYKQCNQLVNKPKFIKAAKQCQKKIGNYYEFQYLLTNGRKKTSKNYYREALRDFTKARRLFYTPELEDEISKCQTNIKQQENYETNLKQSAQIAKQGRFQEAIDLLKSTLDKFSREDGQQLLNKLQRVISAQKLYKLGLGAEKTNKFKEAISKYEQVLNLLPEITECKIRLGAITVKTNPNKSIYYLKGVEGQQAAYIRGFAYIQLENWQQANREWKSISHNEINFQRKILKRLAQRARLSQIQKIELSIDNNIEIAKRLSLEFIKKFGYELTVQQNLENHIQPLLERQIWKAQNWQQIAIKTEKTWLEEQDIESLHNWAIANYYLAQIDSSKLTNFVISWLTALANIEKNPVLKNVLWLGSNYINIKDISTRLKQILENAIDAIKDDNIEKYLQLRDIYRRDTVTLFLIQQNDCGIKINQELFILPSCYQYFNEYFPKIKFPSSLWGALYTDRGLAVAACYEGNTARAIKIKPSKNPFSDADRFADCFISYHEGCYYLQNLEWHKAIKSLQQAKSEIKAKSDWCNEIDRLCELQRKKIDDFDEHLQFAKFWFELLNSQPSRSYFAEYKARKVAQKIANEETSIQQGLKKLKEIQNIDSNNPFILDLIDKAEIIQEEENIKSLIRQNRLEEAVRQAKQSHHESIRFMVAEICINILLKGTESRSLSIDLILQLGNWSYELCPNEPVFQEIYSSLQIL